MWHPDGTIELRDRAKDVIISGGENISTIEVEQALASHPAVLECAVVAIPHERWGERPKAFVTLREGAEATAEELIEHCRARIARFKAPDAVEFGAAAEDLDRQGAEVRPARSRVGRPRGAHQLTVVACRAAASAVLIAAVATGCLGTGGGNGDEAERNAARSRRRSHPSSSTRARASSTATKATPRASSSTSSPLPSKGAQVQLHFRRLLGTRRWQCSFHARSAAQPYGFFCRRESASLDGKIADRGGYTLVLQVNGR